MSLRRAFFAAPILLVVSLSRAGGPADQAAAEQLFREGRRLEDSGRWSEACTAYAASQSHDPSAGTLLRLGNCYEHVGKTTSAWITFKDAVKASEARQRPDWVQLARARIAALEPKLSKLIVQLDAGAAVAGLRITRDGSVVEPAELGVAVPVDPGAHEIAATAPGREPWSTSVTIDASTTRAVGVPVLVTSQTTAAAPVTIETDNDRGRGTRIAVGLSLGGVGLVATTIGVVGGVVAIDKHATAVAGCAAYPTGCSSGAKTANADGYALAAVSTAAFVIGGISLVASAIVLLTLPKVERPAPAGRVWIRPSWSDRSAMLVAGGVW